MTALHFDQLVFSGGGTRCIWQGGFLAAARAALQLQPVRVSGVSGGALAAACFLADRGEALLEIMCAAFAEVDHNVDMWGTEPGERLTPHQRIYQDVVRKTLNQTAIEAIANGPQFQVLLAYPPSTRFPKASTMPLLLANLLDLWLRSTPDLRFPRWAGLKSEYIDARQAASDGKLVDLICNAASIPPVFELEGWNGKKVVDGGMISKAPMPVPDEGRTLVLLTRSFRNLPDAPYRVYAEVSAATPADKLDFTDPQKLQQTWAMGKQDGHAFLNSFTRSG